MKIHRAAKAFPMMGESELAELAEDIRANGLRHPVVFDGDTLLDGRNRVAACKMVGVDYDRVQFNAKNGDSATAFVISANLMRRNLDPDQRAMIVQELLPQFRREAKERQRKSPGAPGKSRPKVGSSEPTLKKPIVRATDQAAKAAGISRAKVEKAAAVKKADPKLAEKVRSGEVPLSVAAKQIDPRSKLNGDVNKAVNSDPEVKWTKALQQMSRIVLGLTEAGSASKLTKRWDRENRLYFVRQLKDTEKILRDFRKEIEA